MLAYMATKEQKMAGMELDMMVDMEVDMVANKVADIVADMVVDNKKITINIDNNMEIQFGERVEL